mmetsp:Transcript_22843/g.77822  ORF Transcript_22843/g.77822 Transcript_22843/m.77822 type:complete len:397 (-) Transcript_22843:297-1487(-)
MWQAVSEHVLVRFQLMSGIACAERRLPRAATAAQIYAAVADCLPIDSNRLVLGRTVLWCDQVQPLMRADGEPIEVGVVRVQPSLETTSTFIGLIRYGRLDIAEQKLRTSADPRELVLTREGGDTAVAWAAYKAKHDACGFDILRLMLSLAPSDAGIRSVGHCFFPLHEAAWGGASPAVAVLLCAACPDAVSARDRSGQTPHQVGEYYHPRKFQWPAPEHLLQCGAELRATLEQQHCSFLQGLALESDLADLAASMAARFFGRRAPAAGPLPLSVQPEQRRPAAARHVERRCSKLPALAGDDSDEEGVRFVQEASSKDSGRFAGVRSVRNRRCAFKERSAVAVGALGLVCHLRQHVVRTVCKDGQRMPVEAKWPSKAQTRRERAMERLCKRAQTDVV